MDPLTDHPDIQALHDDATRAGRPYYTDPETGYRVFTEAALKRQGKCCGSGCRHCPYAHAEIALPDRAALIQQPAWLTVPANLERPADILFWSGGKDSFLTLLRLRERDHDASIVLFTTFDGVHRRVAHQDIDIATIVRQADTLGLPLLGCPLLPGLDYIYQVGAGLERAGSIARLVFGDLHLDHIRGWREDAFAGIASRYGATLEFPLWHADYETLMKRLTESRTPCAISAAVHPALPPETLGAAYDREFADALPPEIDRFGENGEFHTVIKPWESEQWTG